MTKGNRVEFQLLGQKYAIRSEATPEYVRELVAHVEKMVKQVRAEAGSQDSQKLAVLAALYITDELFQSRHANRRTEGTAAERVGALLEVLDKVVPPTR